MASKGKLVLHHVWGFRSTRPLIMYHELRQVYGERVPELEIVAYDPVKFREEKSEALLKLNPNGKVPILQDGDISLFEGTAICLYLLDKFDFEHKLSPQDDAFKAKLFQFAVYMSGTVDNLMATSSPIQRVIKDNLRPGDTPEKISESKEAWDSICGPYLSQTLGDKPWMYGNDFTAIDAIMAYFVVVTQFKRPGWIEQFPNLEAFAEKVKTREAVQKAFGNTST